MGRQQRLELVGRRAGLDIDDAVPLPSDSNDAWRIRDGALRVCWRGDPDRLRREAAVLAALPDDVPHAVLIDAGEVEEFTWTLTRWIDAPLLREVWESLSKKEQATAGDELAQALAGLHSWTPRESIRHAVSDRNADTDPPNILGADLNPLPVDRALHLIPMAREMPGVPESLVDGLAQQLESLRSIDPLGGPDAAVIHGDAHLGNVLWDGSTIVALIDFEWARFGPPDLELQPLLRPEDGHRMELIPRLARTYPGLVDHPDVVERIWLYDLAFTLRHLILWPATGSVGDLPAFHPARRLPEIIGSPSYIEILLSSALGP